MPSKTDIRFCKKCKKVLPYDYKYNYCEACRNQKAQNVKNVFKAVGAVAALVLPVVSSAGKKWKGNGKS